MRRLVSRAGSVVLEPLVALLVVIVAGLTLLTALSGLARTSEAYKRRDREMMAASAFLDRVALWPTEDLDRRLGERSQGPYTLRVVRARPLIYELTLIDAQMGSALLWTAVYRPARTESGHDQ